MVSAPSCASILQEDVIFPHVDSGDIRIARSVAKESALVILKDVRELLRANDLLQSGVYSHVRSL